MSSDPLLNKALGLMRKKNYDSAIKMLESEVFQYQESFQYYHILGLCCLYAGDLGGAFTYFNRAKNIKFRETGPLLGLAFYFLKRGDTEKVVDLYLDIQDLDNGNKIAGKALNLIRKSRGGEELSAWMQSRKATRLYPPIPVPRLKRTALLLPPALLLCLVAAGTVFFLNRTLKLSRAGLENSVLVNEEKSSPVETGGSYRYILTGNEIIRLYDEARNFFNEYRDEKAKYNLNRILQSNASQAIKNKAVLLKSYTAIPGFDTLKDSFGYREVHDEPALYQDCYVVWKGMAANVEQIEHSASFDMLVGYDTCRVMEGAVNVGLSSPAEVNPSVPLEALGKIAVLSGDRFMLEAVGIHQLR
ncbi:MAG: tetratricopeptide repeat protein [Treponema sp.]|jgi:tetratricopeptide (TPR) repeat protein|nr:tetratricopeptide repeat protein [Treponema sp.]